MSARKIRRAEAHKARKDARKAAFPIPASSPAVAPPTPTDSELAAAIADKAPEAILLADIPEPGFPFPAFSSMSAARLAANQANAKLSKGALSPETKAISAQNHTVHGLARHQDGNFKLLSSESTTAFETLRQALTAEHEPSTETERILVNRMVESHWLETRAQRLQDTCMDPDTGEITEEKKFCLYMRYKTTHTRAFHKCLNDLLKLRSEKRKAELGVEAQNRKEAGQQGKNERHIVQMANKEAQTRYQATLTAEKIAANVRKLHDYEEHYVAQLTKLGLSNELKPQKAEAA